MFRAGSKLQAVLRLVSAAGLLAVTSCVQPPDPPDPPAPPCLTDADCGAGDVCEPSGAGCGAMTCVPGCHDDAQCGDGMSCLEVECVTCPCPGLCFESPEPACESDADCSDGEVCEPAGAGCDTPECVPGCHEDEQCGDGQQCQEVACFTCPCPGICDDVPEPPCATDDDCGDGQVCELGGTSCDTPVCVPGCHEDGQCDAGQECTEVACFTCPCPGICDDVPEPPCATDDDCGDGQVCELGGTSCDTPVCVPGCHDDAQCAADETCEAVVCITCPCPGICFAP